MPAQIAKTILEAALAVTVAESCLERCPLLIFSVTGECKGVRVGMDAIFCFSEEAEEERSRLSSGRDRIKSRIGTWWSLRSSAIRWEES